MECVASIYYHNGIGGEGEDGVIVLFSESGINESERDNFLEIMEYQFGKFFISMVIAATAAAIMMWSSVYAVAVILMEMAAENICVRTVLRRLKENRAHYKRQCVR